MTNKEIAHDFLASHGGKIAVTGNITGNTAHVQITANGLANMWADSPPRKLKNYNSGLHGTFSNTSTYFSGGTVEEFKAAQFGKLDETKFVAAREKLGAIREKLAEEMREINPARKRRFTENDGDIDFDRRWELKPYMGTFRTTSGIARTLRIEVEFCFNCAVGADEIAQYGAFAWAVSDAVESSGISCEIVLLSSGRKHCTGDFSDMTAEITVKRAGEYIETLELARRFRTDFYRRAIFALYELTGDLSGGETERSLGKSNSSYPLPVGNGAMRLKIQDATNFNADAAIQKIKVALGIA